MIRLGLACSLLLVAVQPAQAAERWPYSYDALIAFQRGDFAAVLAALRADLAKCEAASPDADQCLNLLLGLANVASMAGNLEGGELYARSAVALAERSLPIGHADIATSWNNLAVNLNIQGRYQEAEPIYRKALALREAALPAGHRDLAASWNGLASNLNAQGRFAEAEPMFRKALALNEGAEKPYPPDIATSWNNLAGNIDAQGRYADAEPLYRKALAMREAALPAGHPDIAGSWNNLAANLTAQRRHADAEPMLRKALALREAALPAGHPDIAASWNNLAANLIEQDRRAEAEPLLRKALAIWLTLRPTHPQRVDGLRAVALTLQRLQRSLPEVRTLYRLAEVGAMERMRSFVGFTPAAEAELRQYRPIFTGQVRAAWDLTQARRKRTR